MLRASVGDAHRDRRRAYDRAGRLEPGGRPPNEATRVRDHDTSPEVGPTEGWSTPRVAARVVAGGALLVGTAVLGAASVHVAFGWDLVERWLPDLVVGLTLVGTGFLAWPRSRAVATLLVAAGLAWFAGNLAPLAVAWHRGPLVHLLLSYPAWRPRGRIDALAIGVGYAAALVPSLWRSESVLVLAAAMLVVLLGRSFLRAGGRDRRYRAAAAWAGTAIASVTVAGSIARQVWSDGTAVLPALLAYEVALGLVAVGLVAVLRRTATAEVTDLVVELEQSRPGSLRDALAELLHDPELEIGYWSERENGYLDARGTSVALPRTPERTTTHVPRGGAPLAVLVHDRAVLADPALADAVAVATRLTGDHADLQVQVRERLAELNASRRRLVVAADEQRRDLAERLRVGPVRRLETLRDAIADVAVGGGELHLSRADEHVAASLGALERLARGLHPLELTNGLAGALAGLAERSPVPIRLTVTNTRFPPELEAAVWFTCLEAVTNATKHAEPTLVTISVLQRTGQLTVSVADDGRGGARPDGTGLRGLADRLDALGGALTIDSAGRGTVLTAELPLPELRA
jgi:signal transduction histidine kinase